jgi:hypothetical protein
VLLSDGTVAVDMDPLSLLCRLAALIPAPRFHTVRYSGVLAPASKWRPLIVPKPLPDARGDATSPGAPDSCGPPPGNLMLTLVANPHYAFQWARSTSSSSPRKRS